MLFVFVGVYTCQLSNSLKKEIAARKKVELYSYQKELEVKELISKFSEIEEKFRSIFHSAIVGIAMTDSHGKFILSNETWNRMLGYSDQEMKNLTNLDITHPDDLDTTRQYSEGLVSGEIQYLRIEKRYITKNKASIWVDLSISKVNLNDGTHFFGIMTDITDKKKIGFELEKLATVDILTSLLNRRAIQPIIDKEMYRRKRFYHPVSLMVIDIDHFKKINDEYGHTSGDKVLSSIANKIKSIVRETDSIARWGGEEFLLLAGNTNWSEAVTFAEKIRQSIMSLDCGKIKGITVSIGIAEYHPDEDFQQWFERADSALYKAKNEGRNRVCFAQSKSKIENKITRPDPCQ